MGSVADVDDSFAVASSSSSFRRARGACARVGRRVVGRRRVVVRPTVARVVVVVVVVVDIANMFAVGAKCARARSIDRSIDRRARARSTARGSTATDDARAVDRREDGFFDRFRVDEC